MDSIFNTLPFLGDLLSRGIVFFPALINLSFAWTFGRTLQKGKEPLITSFARLENDPLPEGVGLYTRRLTLIWTIYFLSLFLFSILLIVFPPAPLYSTLIAISFYSGAAVLFFGEFVYRRYRFKDQKHGSPIELYRKIKKSGLLRKKDTG